MFAYAMEVPSEAAVFPWFCEQIWDPEIMEFKSLNFLSENREIEIDGRNNT